MTIRPVARTLLQWLMDAKRATHLVSGAAAVFASVLVLRIALGTLEREPTIVAIEVGRFEAPTALVAWPGTRDLLLGERGGRLHRLTMAIDGALVSSESVLDISGQVMTEGEGGLLGLAFSPTGDHLYISFTDTNWQSRIVSYQVDPSGQVAGTQELILSLDQPSADHNNGHLQTDQEGRLMVGFGDGGPGLLRDPAGRGRDLTTLHGTLLRILPTPNGESAYVIPPDNPFVDSKISGVRPEILAFGLRNPWRFDLDPTTGDLWIADVGYQLVEEINLLSAKDMASGADFGWAAMEGSVELNGIEPSGHVRPVHEYRHDGVGSRCSVIGGVVVHGGGLAGLESAFLFSDFCDGVIRALLPDQHGEWSATDLGATVELPVSFALSGDGTVFVLSLAGGMYRLDAN